MTRFLASDTRTALLTELASHGFVWLDEQGAPRIPEQFEVAYNANGDAAQYLDKIVTAQAELDDEGNVIAPPVVSSKFHANVTACEGIVFSCEREKPEQPFMMFAE
jgi:hypothetical protein